MYFSYGFPKSYCLGNGDALPSTVVYTSFGGDLLVVVTSTSLQVWSGGQQRLKLGEVVRDEHVTKEEGCITCACWCPSRRVIAVATELGYLHFYGLLVTKEVLWECPDGTEARRLSVYLQNSVSLHSPQTVNSGERVADLCGDARSLLVALENGTFLVYNWQAQFRYSTMPLFGPLATDAAARQRRPMLSRLSSVSSALPSRSASVAASLPLDRTSTLSESADFATADAALPTPLATFYDADPLPAATPVQPSEDVAVRSVSCAPAARLLAVVLQDGRVALVSLPEGGLSAANQARLVRWIYKPTSPAFAAVAAAVQPSGHFVAVGLAHGRVAMYSMAGILSAGKVGSHGSLATPRTSFDSVGSAGAGDGGVRKLHAGLPEPDRIFSLTEWGYSSSLIGAAHLLQWSPDGRVVAVGYARRGVAVWTPSGCRVMCSLRQAAQGMAGPGLGDYAERRELSDGLEVDLESVVGSPSGLNPQHNKPAAEAGVLEAGISALGWSAQGYALVVAEATPGAQNFLELAFARMLPAFHRVSEPLLPSPHHLDAESRSAGGHEAFDAADTDARPTEEEHFVLQAADRLLLVSETLPASVAAAAQAGLIGAGGVEGVNQQPDLVLQHVRLPQHYIDTAFPVLHVAPSPDGRDIAVAGSRGVAVFAHRTRRWRLFGDSVQERKIKVHSLAWLPGGVIAACATIEDGYPVIKGAIQGASAPGPALLLYPKHHLDAASLLARQQLSQLPAAMDAIGPYLALAYEPLRVHVVKADPEGPRIRLTSVRELSILGLGGPLLDMTLLAPSAPETPESTKTSAGKGSKGNLGDQEGPSHCVLLRGGGMLSVLDMQQGSEVVLSDKIEAYWLPSSPGATPALPKMLLPHTPSGGGVGRDDSAAAMQTSPAAKGAAWLERRTSDAAAAAAAALREAAGEAAAAAEEEAVRVEMPWWTFGARGMQLWFPSTFSDPQLSPATAGMGSLGGHTGSSPLAAVAGARGGANATDPELEFDKEVYPLGVSLSEVSIFGIMQRMARSTVLPLGSPAALSFHPHPESQPVLPCLLRRLLEQGQAADALELATRHSKGPHFARSLEWLLFTTLEADADLPKDGTPAARRVRFQREQGAGPQPDSPFSPKSVGKAGRRLARAGPLLIAAARLVEQFPQAAEIVVSVARKTDAQLWPALFAAAGSPAALCDGLLSNGTLQSAACCLLIVDYIEGSAQAHRLALKLVRAALASGSYELTADLLRFLVPPGEGELAGIVDAARSGSGGLGDGPGQAPVEANGGSGTASGEGLASWLWSYFSGADKVVTATMTPSAQHSGEGPTAALHRAVSAASLAESEESHTELTPAIHAWRAMGNHAWRLLDAGALRELAAMGLALGDLHGGLAAVLSTTAGDVPLSLGHTTPSAAAIASALFVASNEFAAADSDADVAVAAQTLLQACYAARCANHVAALSLVLGDAGRLESFSAEHPRVWALLQDLIANDVHLCSFVPVLSPPGTPLLLTESSLGA